MSQSHIGMAVDTNQNWLITVRQSTLQLGSQNLDDLTVGAIYDWPAVDAFNVWNRDCHATRLTESVAIRQVMMFDLPMLFRHLEIRHYLYRPAPQSLLPLAGESQGALADGVADRLVGRDGGESGGLRRLRLAQSRRK